MANRAISTCRAQWFNVDCETGCIDVLRLVRGVMFFKLPVNGMMIPNAFHIVFSGGGDTMFLSPWYLMVKSSCYPIFPEMIPYFMIIPSSRIPPPSSHIIP